MSFTIVSIEDESEMTELLATMLGGPDVRFVSSDTAFDGLALVREIRPALLILDIMLPDMDGWSVYDAVRADPVTSKIPVIMLTALRRQFQSRRALPNRPPHAHVAQPVAMPPLRHPIDEILGPPPWLTP